MTQALFDQQPFLKETTATVLSCQKAENGFAVILDQTIFFPEGGGQPADRGTINGVAVTDTQWQGEEIAHLCTAPLPVQAEVTLCLDWERRFDLMQQHSGEHILSYAFWYLFDAVNVGFHLNEQFGTINLDRVLTWEQIEQGVQFANQLIFDNRAIHTYVGDNGLLKKKKARKISQKGGDTPRVVEVDGADICTCCGTHVAQTGQIGSITVIKAEKNRQGSRLTFLCGNRALADAMEKTAVLHELTTLLSTDCGQLAERVREMKQSLQESGRALAEKNRLIFDWQAERLLHERGESPYVLACLSNATPPEARTLLNRLIETEPVTAMVVFTKGDSLSFFCGANEHAQGQSCKTVCDLLCGIFNGKGGGKGNFAQGGGKLTPDWQELAHQILQQLIRMS